MLTEFTYTIKITTNTKETPGFHIDLLNTSNQKVSGTVDITVKGY